MEHANILQFHGYYMDKNYICIVTDLMQTTLMDYLNVHYDELNKESKIVIFI